jgi:hypothetical protein
LVSAPVPQIDRVDCERHHTTRHALTTDSCPPATAETGNHLWAERFDKQLADFFDMPAKSSRA